MKYILENLLQEIKFLYVKMMHIIGFFLKITGLLDKFASKAHNNRICHYFCSLFAIYDLKGMIRLDVPWWTYSGISMVEQYLAALQGNARVFEYGSGASTIWLARRSQQVISVEHDNQWFHQLKAELKRTTIHLCLKKPSADNMEKKYQSAKIKGNFKDYVTYIKNFNQFFDLIVIDGRCRESCLEQAMLFLKPTGIIVFDNSDRPRYQAALIRSGLRVQRFKGCVPGSPFKSETALLCFPSLKSFSSPTNNG